MFSSKNVANVAYLAATAVHYRWTRADWRLRLKAPAGAYLCNAGAGVSRYRSLSSATIAGGFPLPGGVFACRKSGALLAGELRRDQAVTTITVLGVCGARWAARALGGALARQASFGRQRQRLAALLPRAAHHYKLRASRFGTVLIAGNALRACRGISPAISGGITIRTVWRSCKTSAARRRAKKTAAWRARYRGACRGTRHRLGGVEISAWALSDGAANASLKVAAPGALDVNRLRRRRRATPCGDIGRRRVVCSGGGGNHVAAAWRRGDNGVASRPGDTREKSAGGWRRRRRRMAASAAASWRIVSYFRGKSLGARKRAWYKGLS